MEKIKSISEAYSQQPKSEHIVSEQQFEHYYDKPNACKEIKKETVKLGYECGNEVEILCYVGYNFDGKKLFQYKCDSVNVEYY
jgi:hypothetical protein